MAIKISEDELLEMPSELLLELREYLKKRRETAKKAEGTSIGTIDTMTPLYRDQDVPFKIEYLETDRWEVAEAGLILTEVGNKNRGGHVGIRVEQEGETYIARRWRLTKQVKDIVQLAVNYGFDKLWRNGHPQKAYFKDNVKYEKGSPHIGFSTSHNERWLFVLGAEARPPNVNVITFESGNEEYLKKILTTELAPRMPIKEGAWQWEGRGGNNIFVHPSDLEKILKGIKELRG